MMTLSNGDMSFASFAYDDYPRDRDYVVGILDRFKTAWPGFRANVFAVPVNMTAADWEPLIARKDWIRVCPHGFRHNKAECRTPAVYERKLRQLRKISRDERYSKAYKAPWYGYDWGFVQKLDALGYVVCIAALPSDSPYPLPNSVRVFSLNDHMRRATNPLQHVDTHPVTLGTGEEKAAITALFPEFVERYLQAMSAMDEWAYIEDLAEPSLVKLNLACGEHVWDDWWCCDQRRTDERIHPWVWPERLPFAQNRADVALVSHFFEYLPDEEYEDFLLEVWRVLRPCTVLRISDIETSGGYSWRPIGSTRTRGTGTIRSHPTLDRVRRACHNVGFQTFPAGPGVTLSPHKDVLRGDTRHRRLAKKHKFYLEAVKAICTPDYKRSRWYDGHATRTGVYLHARPQDIVGAYLQANYRARKRTWAETTRKT